MVRGMSKATTTCFVPCATATQSSSFRAGRDFAESTSLKSDLGSAACRVPLRTRRCGVAMTSRSSNSGMPDGRSSEEPQGTASWRDEVRMLLDPSLSLSAKSILAQDMAKRAPSLSREVFDDVCETVGLDGVPAVVRQVTEDILPDLVANGPRYVSELGQRIPDLVADTAEAVRRGPPSMASGSPTELVTALTEELRNVFNRTPEGLETPSYEILADDRLGYQLRRYPAIFVAEADMSVPMDSAATEGEAANAAGKSFNTLATYLFGKNSSGVPMAMTTPVIMDRRPDASGSMSFIVPSKFSSDKDMVPTPLSPVSNVVSIEERPAAAYAVAEFTGYATAGEVRRQRQKLLDSLARDGVPLAEPDANSFTVLVYNGPSTIAFKRRNELCVKILLDDQVRDQDQGLQDALYENSYLSMDSVTD
jgi:hypothetical protein